MAPEKAFRHKVGLRSFSIRATKCLKAALRLADPKASKPFDAAVMKILNMLGVEAISYVDEENNSDGAAVNDVVEGKSTVYLIEGREFARIEGSCTQTGGESGGKATAQREHMGRRLPACVIVPAA